MIQEFFFVGRLFASAFMIIGLFSCEKKQKINSLFNLVPASHSNISFNNSLQDSDDFNIIEYLYFYNGGGVAIGDINNDGLPDLYFSSNQGANKLYLNKGNLEFEDITSSSGTAASGNWKTGVTFADVNGDGLLDIFVCGVGKYKKFDGKNQLLLNNGDLTFTDKTKEFGLDFQGFSTQASFFDYDNDGDLDMYLVNHSVHTTRSYGRSSLRYESDPLAGDKLYQNQLIQEGRTYFKEVTSQAGILNSQIGYGLAVGVSDLNRDGFLDIYVSNDFNENDYLYINKGNGTFTQELEKSIPHSSRFSMGNDIADINNDGLTDILTLDMLPKNEEIIKTTAGEDAYEIYAFKLRYGYHYQFARNTLQLNRGSDSKNNLMFSDIAPLAGVEATDWSWAPLLADFDNDGYKDLFVANGILRRPNDLDYINYISSDSAQRYFSDQKLIDQMPSGKVSNVIFRNKGNLQFEDMSKTWIGTETSLSNGAAYGDLDNDGDLDIVVNNINEPAFIYRNDLPIDSSKFLKIKLEGDSGNRFGVGTKITLYAGDNKIFYEQIPSRGWLSSVDYLITIGLGKATVDSICIQWPGNKSQTLKSVQENGTIVIKQSKALDHFEGKALRQSSLVSEYNGVSFKHDENNFVAFNVERFIPHMISTQGPKISVGDVNGDRLDDFFVGGAAGQSSAIFVQGKDESFNLSSQPSIALDSMAEDVSSAFFDADGNGTPDLMVVSGGQEFGNQHPALLPRLYLNNGSGKFGRARENLPDIFVNASCIKASDIDRDGDLDVFIGGRVLAGQYGVDPPSFLLINNGQGVFRNESVRLPTGGENGAPLGMVTDAVWIDLNSDAKDDLVVVGEWMPISIFIQNESGGFDNKTNEYGLAKTNGWWNTLAANDFDKDGDVDFVVGNLGLNSRLRCNALEPVSIFIGDIDGNGSLDHLLTYHNMGKRYPLIARDQLIKQVPVLKRKFLKYASYKNVTLEDIVKLDVYSKFIRKDAFTFASVYLKNNNGKFLITNLPVESQMFPVFAFGIDDLNDDGNTDILVAGNLDATQPEFGRYDAGYGSTLLGDGAGDFKSVTFQHSGFVVKGEARDIKTLVTSKNKKLFLVSRNNDTISAFQRVKN